ncbi:GspH/FimT family pseudopilin [Sphingomonas sp. G-3-2-10]|uniref:GspH/FimT family pseudopilin n=1 Tax=Sphingomonas sp. G-3-2-10 TaxID=2728838 RepID=UPI003217796B
MPGGRSIRTASQAGFTLIEMIIVLAIVAVAAGVVTLSVGGVSRPPSVEAEARRLATRLQTASDDAMLGDRIVALTITEDGYGFATLGEGGQMIPRTDKALSFHQLPAGMVMTLSAKPPVMLGADGTGQPVSATIESGKQRWLILYDGMTVSVRKAQARS